MTCVSDQFCNLASIIILSMSLHSCNLSLATALLLLISMTTIASGQQCDSDGCRRHELSKLFEEALVSSSDSLWKLQQIYFDPSSDQSPALIYLSVSVTINNITNNTCWCNQTTAICDMPVSDTNAAFDLYYCSECNTYNSYYCTESHYGQWMFFSSYILQPSSSSQLAELMTTSGSTNVFYAIDPSFYSIMKALSNSIELLLESHTHSYEDPMRSIEIHINTTLHENPHRVNAYCALRMILVWVSFM